MKTITTSEKRKQYLKNYFAKEENKVKHNEATRKYHSQNPDILKKWREENKDKIKEYRLKYKEKNILSETIRKNSYSKEYYKKMRITCLNHYGKGNPKCECCGESEFMFLALDHIEGKGNKHRKEIKGNMCQWAKKNNYPPIFQILCHNCNSAKGYYGICPHKTVVHPTKMN